MSALGHEQTSRHVRVTSVSRSPGLGLMRVTLSAVEESLAT